MGIAGQIDERPASSGARRAADFEYVSGLMQEAVAPFVPARAAALWAGAYQALFLQKAFDDPGMRILILKDTPVGCYCLSNQGDSLRLQAVYIDPAFQGQGLEQYVAKRAIEAAHDARLPLELYVPDLRLPCFDTWMDTGFYPNGDVARFYGPGASDHVGELQLRCRETDRYLSGASFRVLPPQLPGFRPA